MESAKSYREKKAKPLWNKLVTLLRSLYRSYLDLKEHYNNLLQRYNRQCLRTDDMADRIAELTEQNKQFTVQKKQSTQALETLKQAFGKDQVEATLEATNQKRSKVQVQKKKSAPAHLIISLFYTNSLLTAYLTL